MMLSKPNVKVNDYLDNIQEENNQNGYSSESKN